MLVTVDRFFQIGQPLVQSALLFCAVYLGFQIPDSGFQGIGLDFIGQIIFHGIDSGGNGRLGIVITLHHIGVQIGNPVVQTAG